MKVLVDSDFYIGIYAKNDIHNKHVQAILNELDEGVSFYTSWEVIDEVATKLFYFVSKQTAIKFLKDLDKLKIITIYPNDKLQKLTIDLFSKTESKNVSLTDCFNAIVFRELKLDYILSFDKDYKKLGAKIYYAKVAKR